MLARLSAACFLLLATKLCLALASVQPASEANVLSPLEPSLRHARTAEEILLKLQRRHYHQRMLDDELSSALLDNYLDSLDPGKRYFTKADLEALEKYRYVLDDGIRRGNLSPSFEIFNLYRGKAIAHLDGLLENLPARIEQLDFTLDESIALDADTLDWATSESQLHDRSRKALKAAVLSLRLEDKSNEEIAEVLGKRYRNQLDRTRQLNAEDAFQLYMNSLTELYDPHTNYMSPRNAENFSINMRLSLEGIGAVLRRDGEYTVVERLIAAGPAEKQGELKRDDKIIGVGQGADGPVVDVVGWRLDEVVELIRGRKGTTVSIEVISKPTPTTEETKRIEIVRNTVKLEEQAAKKSVIEVFHEDELHRIGVISIPTFYIDFDKFRAGDEDYKSTTRDVKNLLKELEQDNVEGVIVDLRGNSGGSLREVKDLIRLFVEKGPVVQVRSARGRIDRANWNYPNPEYYRKPMAVLIDRLSASASEIFAGAIQDYQRGLIVGSQSFGKGTVQQLAPLSHGSLKLTEAKFYRISGESTQHRGVIPDIELPSLLQHQEVGEDTLDFALEWDTVKAVKHRKYGEMRELVPALTEKHQKRIENDPDYVYLSDQIALSKRFAELEQLPLNESQRRAMREQDEADRLAIENNHRKAKGLPLLDALESDDETAEEADAGADSEEESDPRNDFLLTETANILIDAILMGVAPAEKTAAASAPRQVPPASEPDPSS